MIGIFLAGGVLGFLFAQVWPYWRGMGGQAQLLMQVVSGINNAFAELETLDRLLKESDRSEDDKKVLRLRKKQLRERIQTFYVWERW